MEITLYSLWQTKVINSKKKYLKFTKLNHSDCKVTEISCDIFNSKKKNLLSKKIMWGKKHGLCLSYHVVNVDIFFKKYKFDINFNKDFYAKSYEKDI